MLSDVKASTKYLEELSRQLRSQGLTVHPRESRDIDVELDGSTLCRINDLGNLGYFADKIAGKEAILDRIRDMARSTREYMTLLEQAPPLKADGLEDGYQLLAEFNGTVLAGHMTRYGAQFVTWEWVRNKTSLWQGHYYDPNGHPDSYQSAKRDFAVRSGLLPACALFKQEQLAEIYRSIHETLDGDIPLTDERRKALESAVGQIEEGVPDLEERVAVSAGRERELGLQLDRANTLGGDGRRLALKPVFSVILWNDEKPNFNHTVIFPAYPYALEDILEKAQAKNEASLHWEINDTVFDLEYLLPISERSGSIRELNALAQKLSELDRAQQIGFLGLLKLEQGTLDAPLPLSRIIDLAYGTQCCQVIPELRSEVELAYHCVEEGLIPEFKDLPQEQLRLINYPLLGEKQRKAEGGVFVQSKSSSMSGYVRQTAPIGHTSLDLTPERPKYAMLLSISNKWSSGARRSKQALLELPMAEDALTSILAEYDGLGDDGEVWDRIAWRGRDCVVPQLTDMLFDYGSDRGYTESAMRYLNYLAGKLSRVKPEILPAYKALLSAMDCRDLSTADRLLDAVDSYRLSPQINNPSDMVEDKLNKLSGQNVSLLISHVNMDRYGETLIEESGGELTPYGLLTRRNGQPVKDVRNQPEQLGWQSGMGDITKLDGARLPPVDIICGGSPCQDCPWPGRALV